MPAAGQDALPRDGGPRRPRRGRPHRLLARLHRAPAGGARVPDGAAAPRPLRVDERWRFTDTRASGARGCPRSRTRRRPRRGSTPRPRATRWWPPCSRSDAATSSAWCSSSCASPGSWAGTGRARAWTGRAPSTLRIPLDLPSVFQGVTRNRTVFVGRPGPEETDRAFLEAIGKKAGTTAAALSRWRCAGRVVNLMWGDSGTTGAGARRPRPAARLHAEDPPGLPPDHPGPGGRERKRGRAGARPEDQEEKKSA